MAVSRASLPANPYVGVTFIPDNPRMATPPAWFLQRVYDFDAQLVLMPSRMRAGTYVIARRQRRPRAQLTAKALIDTTTQQKDTQMCLKHGCVPVCLMFHFGSTWNADALLAKLKARDTWALGGGEKAADLLDAQDESDRQRQRQAIRDDLWHRSGDGWRTYQTRTGQRVLSSGGVTPATPEVSFPVATPSTPAGLALAGGV